LSLKDVHIILKDKDIDYPLFDIFLSNNSRIKVAHFQPYGHIDFYNDNGCIPRDKNGNRNDKILAFLDKANCNSCELLMMPEYSVPYELLNSIIIDEHKWPKKGKLWVFGMEAIRTTAFEKFAAKFNDNEDIKIKCIMPSFASNSYCNLLFYIFISEIKLANNEKKEILVLLPQFKNMPTKEENEGMSCGHDVYVFKDSIQNTTSMLSTLICSDALSKNAQEYFHGEYAIYKKLILNLQLNPDFSHEGFDSMYKNFYIYADRPFCQILSLGWASGTKIFTDDNTIPAKYIKHGYTSWYQKDNGRSVDDDELIKVRTHSGLSKGIFNYINAWYAPYIEHVLIFSILPFNPPPAVDALISSPIAITETDNKLYFFDGDNNLNAEIQDEDFRCLVQTWYCPVNWNWLKEIFGLQCEATHTKKICLGIKVNQFINLFSVNKDYSFQILGGRICIGYINPELFEDANIDNYLGKKAQLEYIGRFVLGSIGTCRFPKYVAYLTDGFYFDLNCVPKRNISFNVGDGPQSLRIVFCSTKIRAKNWIEEQRIENQRGNNQSTGVNYRKYDNYSEKNILIGEKTLICYNTDNGIDFYHPDDTSFLSAGINKDIISY